MTIKNKITFGFLGLILLSLGIGVLVYLILGMKFQQDQILGEKLLQARALAAAIDGEAHTRFSSTEALDDPLYQQYIHYLSQYKAGDPGITYLYTLAPSGEDFIYVLDADILEEDQFYLESSAWSIEVFPGKGPDRPRLRWNQEDYSTDFFLPPEWGADRVSLRSQKEWWILSVGDQTVMEIPQAGGSGAQTPGGPVGTDHVQTAFSLPGIGSVSVTWGAAGLPSSLPGVKFVNTPQALDQIKGLFSRGEPAVVPGRQQDIYGEYYQVAAPILNSDGKPAGILMLEIYSEEVESFLRQYLQSMVIGALPALGVAFLLALLLAGHLTHPLKELVPATRRVQQGDFSIRLKSTRTDEYRLLIESFNDMTEDLQRSHQSLELHAQEMDILSRVDVVTGLENRRSYYLELEDLLGYLSRLEQPVVTAVMFLDLDRFKEVNDSLGHAAGDELLKIVAHRLQGCLRSTDSVYRLGGDEFTIILSPLGQELDAALVAGKIIEALRQPVEISGHSVPIGISIGVAFYPQDGRDAQTLTRHADTALYEAKRIKFSPVFFAPFMTEKVQKAAGIREDLARALENHEFHLVYQPIVDQDGKLVSAEALMRWNRPGSGPVSPSEFIPILEESSQISKAGLWALETARLQLLDWERGGHPLPSLSVNLSVRQLKDSSFRREFLELLDLPGADHERLYFEVTETMLAQEPDIAALIRSYEEKGMKFALDDFGTGFSSLSTIAELPISFLKIDKSFVDEIPGNPKMEAIIRATIEIARAMKALTVAEGVETPQQFAFLKAAGCHRFQGYLFSRPVESDKLLAQYPLPE